MFSTEKYEHSIHNGLKWQNFVLKNTISEKILRKNCRMRAKIVKQKKSCFLTILVGRNFYSLYNFGRKKFFLCTISSREWLCLERFNFCKESIFWLENHDRTIWTWNSELILKSLINTYSNCLLRKTILNFLIRV